MLCTSIHAIASFPLREIILPSAYQTLQVFTISRACEVTVTGVYPPIWSFSLLHSLNLFIYLSVYLLLPLPHHPLLYFMSVTWLTFSHNPTNISEFSVNAWHNTVVLTDRRSNAITNSSWTLILSEKSKPDWSIFSRSENAIYLDREG